MIDVITFRIRIGTFHKLGHRVGKNLSKIEFKYRCSCFPSGFFDLDGSENNFHSYSFIFAFTYTFLTFLSVLLGVYIETIGPNDIITTKSVLFLREYRNPYNFSLLSSFCITNIRVSVLLLCRILFTKRQVILRSFQKCKKRSIRFLYYLSLFALLLNFLLIGICNSSLLNPGPLNTLTVSYQNVQGLVPFSQLGKDQPKLDQSKVFELNGHIENSKPDVLILNETWLCGAIKSKEFIFNSSYEVFRNDRSEISHPSDPRNPNKFRKFGGGVLIAIRSDIQATFKRISMRKGAEVLAIEMTVGSNKYVFCTVYRVGTLGERNHNSIVQSIRSMYSGRSLSKVFIIGDFNLSSISWSNSFPAQNSTNIDKMFFDSFSELGLLQCIRESTHIKGRTLDILLSNHVELITDVKVDSLGSICRSDHSPIEFKVKVATRFSKPKKRKILNFKKADWCRLNEDLRAVPWSCLIDNREPEFAWNNFRYVLSTLVDKHIPTITVSDDFSAPWFDSECFVAYRNKERAHARLKGNPSIAAEIKRDFARRQFKNICNEKMRDNLYNSDDPALITKKFWSHVKSKSKSHRIPECVHLGNNFRNQPVDKANLFNDHFYAQFSEPSVYDVDLDWTSDHLFDIDFSPTRICNLLATINSNKACGPDGIHGKILKNCASSLAFPLSTLFTLSYNSGSLPKDWKIANVVPVHKKGSKDDVENYRPISLTSLVMKTFERILKDELLLRVDHLLDARQHGFLNDRSCTTNMVSFVDSVTISLNDVNTLSTDVVYFDFSKAFDSVNHDLIINKLKYSYGIDGRFLKFIIDYLKGREQSVVIENCCSSMKSVLSGVPQGSILGPILFVLFINDLPLNINSGTNIALYADDTKIWRPIKSERDQELLQSDINSLDQWAQANKMRFHPKKCKVLSIGCKPSPLEMLPFTKFYYHLGENLLEYAENEKDLGVIINCKLNFDEQRENLLTTAKQKFGLLRRTCNFVCDIRRRRVLYLTLVRSQFEHCSVIWRPNSETAMKKLENFQKKCLKWVLGEEELSYSHGDTYINKCKQADILPLEQRFKLNDLVLFHKVLHNLLPLATPEYMSWYDGSSRLRRTHLDHRSLTCGLLPRTSTTHLLDKSFFFRCHSLWNSLPLQVRDIASPSRFKGMLVSHLWAQCLNTVDIGAE
ncbi:MAG TPA: hypothetical protein DDY16_05865 [Tenacibaculum sp.]|nr:hypothetical protein [Tenacibaculum sp.]